MRSAGVFVAVLRRAAGLLASAVASAAVAVVRCAAAAPGFIPRLAGVRLLGRTRLLARGGLPRRLARLLTHGVVALRGSRVGRTRGKLLPRVVLGPRVVPSLGTGLGLARRVVLRACKAVVTLRVPLRIARLGRAARRGSAIGECGVAGIRRARDLAARAFGVTAEISGPRAGLCRRVAVVHRRELRAVGAGEVLLLALHSGRFHVAVAIRRHFAGGCAGIDAAAAAVVADAVGFAVIADAAVVGVVNVGHVHVIHRAVVIEMIVVPVAAFVAVAEIAEAVIHAAVEADVRAPVSTVPEIAAAAPAPISGSPEEADLRRQNPDAGNPVVAGIGVGPIARSPDVTVTGAKGLGINRQGWRSEADRDADAKTSRSGRRASRNRESD